MWILMRHKISRLFISCFTPTEKRHTTTRRYFFSSDSRRVHARRPSQGAATFWTLFTKTFYNLNSGVLSRPLLMYLLDYIVWVCWDFIKKIRKIPNSSIKHQCHQKKPSESQKVEEKQNLRANGENKTQNIFSVFLEFGGGFFSD